MNANTIVITAIVSVIVSAATAWITSYFSNKSERKKWQREFSIKLAQARENTPGVAKEIEEHHAIGVLIYENPQTGERERFFLAPHSRHVAGRESSNSICIHDPIISRKHCSFYTDAEYVSVEDLGSPNASFVNDKQVSGKVMLHSGDVIRIGGSDLKFQQLSSREKNA